MKLELEMKPLNKGKYLYVVVRHLKGRQEFMWFGRHSLIVWNVFIIGFISYYIYILASSGWNLSELDFIDWFLLAWLLYYLPETYKTTRNWILSRGASFDPSPPLVAGYNTGKMTVDLTESNLHLSAPLVDEIINWSAINTVFEHRKHIYLASGHNPVLVLPASKEIRTFLQGHGYSFEK